MAFTGTQLKTDIGVLLSDTGNVSWTETELLAWINAGQREAVRIKPTLTAANLQMTPVAGSKQILIATVYRLLAPIANVDATNKETDPVKPISREQLDNLIPGWKNETATAAGIKFMVYQPELDPRGYYVFPPYGANPTYKIAVAASLYPVDLATIAATSSLPDEVREALVEYVLYRCRLKEDSPDTLSLASSHWQAFVAKLGVGESVPMPQKAQRSSA